jgi:phage/plasmid-like protein (TIGR03299 family)
MAHEIERYVGNVNVNPWWRGLPETVEVADERQGNIPTAALREAGGLFDYTVEARPVFTTVGGVPTPMDDTRAQVRVEGNGTETFLAATGAEYRAIQPSYFLDFLDALAATGKAEVKTAGRLREGRLAWALAEVGQFAVQADVIKEHVLVWDAYDGSSRFLVKPVTTVVVCANTAAVALDEEAKPWAAIKHSGDVAVKIDDALRTLSNARRAHEAQQAIMRDLAVKPFTRNDMSGFAAMMLTGLDDLEAAVKAVAQSEGRSRTMYDGKGGELVRLWDEGTGAQERGNTAYRALNAVTEFLTWQRGRMGNYKRRASRLGLDGVESNLVGDGDRKVKRAVKLLTRW